MSLEADLVTTLGDVFSGRFYPMVAPANVAAPYAVYQIVSRVPESAMDGATPNLDNARVQVSIFGRNLEAIIALVSDTKGAMLQATLFSSICVNEMDQFEDPALLYGKLIDFSIWRDRAITFELREDGGIELRE